MVSVDALQHVYRHAKEARSMPSVSAVLHEPRRASMPQNVWSHLGAKTSFAHRRGKAPAHVLDRLAVPLHDRVFGNPEPLPATHVREEAERQPNGWPTLFRLTLTGGAAVKHTMVKVDVSAANCWRERSPTNSC